MSELTYLELFAGVGGMSLGFDRAGFRCVGHAEIEPFPRRVLQYRWPDVPLFGDVRDLRGTQVERPTIVTFGAPCQDLSVAGKRAGLAGERSSLFYEGIRLWNETQATYALYENVLGALSSNKGGDFALVLSAFVGSPVAVPADGWRGGGGVVCGRTGVAAWRVLDAQFFGVPQRRRRVFVLGARAGGVDPAEVLSLAESLSGDTAESGEAREGIAAAVGAGVEGGIGTYENSGYAKWTQATVAGCLRVAKVADQHVAFHATQTPISGSEAPSLGASAQVGVLAFDTTQVTSKANRSNPQVGDPCHPLAAGANPPLLVYDARGNGDGKVVSTLPSENNRVTDYTPVMFRMQRSDAYDQATVASTVASRDYKSATDLVVAPAYTSGAHPGSYNGMDAVPMAAAILAAAPMIGRPRRLTPLECERLMGWPEILEIGGENEAAIRQAIRGCCEKASSAGHSSEVLREMREYAEDSSSSPRHSESPNVGDDSLLPLPRQGAYGSWGLGAGASAEGELRCVRFPLSTQEAQTIRHLLGSEVSARDGVAISQKEMGCIARLVGWTDVPDKKGKSASDSARYKACGNGVATPVAHWIALRLRQAIEGVR